MCLLVVQVRILKRSEGIIASVSLSHLIPTFVYDVEPSVAWHLIASGSGQEVLPSTPALVVAIDEPNALEVLTRGVNVTAAPATAADKPRRPRKKR
jgi:hypothetical protein